MCKNTIPMNELEIGKSGRVSEIKTHGEIRRRLLDLGMVEGTKVTALQKSPAGDPTAYFIRGTVIAVRSEDAENIRVSREDDAGRDDALWEL